MLEPPASVDRIIIHQFDAAHASPGGIDTCIRGLARYFDGSLAIIGVDSGRGSDRRRLGVWEEHRFGDRHVWFLPVARLDPGDQSRIVPHSLKLVLGMMRYIRRIPISSWKQAHRMDVALVVHVLFHGRLSYFIHTQENGLISRMSDSLWKRAAPVHRKLERDLVKRSPHVVVFNRPYAMELSKYNKAVQFSPTWHDQTLRKGVDCERPERCTLIWVGRLEPPKDPILSISVLERLVCLSPELNWKLLIIGSGTLEGALQEAIREVPQKVGHSIHLMGRRSADEVAEAMSKARVLLMTSHAGYEGFPRVLVEGLAAGLAVVATSGSDTGSLVQEGRTGYITDRDPSLMARKVLEAVDLSPHDSRESVKHLEAAEIVRQIYAGVHTGRANPRYA